jgi:5'(3')-deoxyribonucleotidase
MVRIQSPNKIILAKKKKKKIKIFLDMDGCISDWLGAACNLCDIDLNDTDIREGLKKKNGFLEDFVDEKVLWKNIEEAGVGYWENLDIFPWAKKLYKSLEELGDDFSILSSPGKFTEIASLACDGKVLWLDKHFDNKKNYIFAYNKSICASENTILVDDSQHKIDPFVEEGGHGFLWPNPLSLIDGDKDVDDTIDELVDYIERMKDGEV